MKIGVLSDTHGHFDPKIPKLFAGVDHILHGGDVGLPWLILELEQIAPVTAVLGNNDAGLEYRETEVVEFDGRKYLVHHIVDPGDRAFLEAFAEGAVAAHVAEEDRHQRDASTALDEVGLLFELAREFGSEELLAGAFADASRDATWSWWSQWPSTWFASSASVGGTALTYATNTAYRFLNGALMFSCGTFPKYALGSRL